MYLYHCIFIGASVFLIGATETTSNHAKSSQSYDRGDVSLSYQYNLIHVYTTSKPQDYSNNSPNHKYKTNKLPQTLSQNIQYAPLPLKTEERHFNQIVTPQQDAQTAEDTETSTFAYDNDKSGETDAKEEKEQKRNIISSIVSMEPSVARPLKYVPGCNVNLQAVNNKLMQNGLYASNPNFLVKNKQVNVNYLQPQASYQREDNDQGLKNKESGAKVGYSVLVYPQEVKKYNGNIVPEEGNNEMRSNVYVKVPKVDLNIARAHHIARALYKASVSVNSSFRKLPSLPQEFFSNSQILQPSKSKLYPVLNSKLYMYGRTA